jgi:hypothetical protein
MNTEISVSDFHDRQSRGAVISLTMDNVLGTDESKWLIWQLLKVSELMIGFVKVL